MVKANKGRSLRNTNERGNSSREWSRRVRATHSATVKCKRKGKRCKRNRDETEQVTGPNKTDQTTGAGQKQNEKQAGSKEQETETKRTPWASSQCPLQWLSRKGIATPKKSSEEGTAFPAEDNETTCRPIPATPATNRRHPAPVDRSKGLRGIGSSMWQGKRTEMPWWLLTPR